MNYSHRMTNRMPHSNRRRDEYVSAADELGKQSEDQLAAMAAAQAATCGVCESGNHQTQDCKEWPS